MNQRLIQRRKNRCISLRALISLWTRDISTRKSVSWPLLWHARKMLLDMSVYVIKILKRCAPSTFTVCLCVYGSRDSSFLSVLCHRLIMRWTCCCFFWDERISCINKYSSREWRFENHALRSFVRGNRRKSLNKRPTEYYMRTLLSFANEIWYDTENEYTRMRHAYIAIIFIRGAMRKPKYFSWRAMRWKKPPSALVI
jgi:hypothetical protein